MGLFGAQEATATLQSFSPRMREWLAKVPLPAEQGMAVAQALEHNGYTSTDFISGEDVHQLMTLPLVADLTPGAKAAIRKLAQATPPPAAHLHHTLVCAHRPIRRMSVYMCVFVCVLSGCYICMSYMHVCIFMYIYTFIHTYTYAQAQGGAASGADVTNTLIAKVCIRI